MPAPCNRPRCPRVETCTVRRYLGAVGSVGVHAVVLAYLATRTPAATLPPTATPSIPIDDPPIAVVVLDPVETAAATTSATGDPARSPRTRALAFTAAASAITPAPLDPRVPHDPHTAPAPSRAPASPLRMRYGPDYTSTIDALVARAADLPAGTPPPPAGEPRGDSPNFTMHVARDGTVAFTDRPNVGRDDVQSRAKLERELRDWYTKPAVDHYGHKAPTVEVWGSIDPGDHSGAIILPLAGGHFDATDAIMRARGEDPHAAEKLRMLDATRDERARAGLRYHKDQLANAAAIVGRNLAHVFATIADPAAQRRALFALWDECDEGGGDDAHEATAVARELIVGAIRERFPAGSPQAFTAAELAELEAHRTSRAHFAPYE